ncbi:MAG: hypothetical protein M3010_07320 [Candidatus Dormibacteraeota bacterium]|nr:hypothetical protein [Candidatus Dormibacteraeota bacterium]
MLAEPLGYSFVVLLRDEEDARGLARLLEGLRLGPPAPASRFVVPPVRGLDFFASAAAQPLLDRWWADTVDAAHAPVFIVEHERGLPEWLVGIDGHFYVGVRSEEIIEGYGSLRATFGGTHPLDYARLVMRDHATSVVPLFSPQEAVRLATLAVDLGAVAAAAEPGAHGVVPSLARSAAARTVDQPGDRHRGLSLLDRLGRAYAGASARRMSTRGVAMHGRRDGGASAVVSDLLNRGPTIVVMGSRKGGVGKTSFAAGVAIQGGQLLDSVGHTACLVDANLANPDAWGELSLPARAATVRQAVAALTENRDPPSPVHAQTPALACYPESREASEYSQTDIDLLAAYLRRRYTLIVVDMSNRLPDPLGGPEAAVAAYWLEHADVLVLPTGGSRQDFNGVLDYLDVAALPPVVVPYIVPRTRAHRDHRVTQSYLAAIRPRVHALVEIPDQADEVRLAGMESLPAERLSPSLRRAYRRLTEAVVAAPRRTSGVSS